jgi:hypothetical protein
MDDIFTERIVFSLDSLIVVLEGMEVADLFF